MDDDGTGGSPKPEGGAGGEDATSGGAPGSNPEGGAGPGPSPLYALMSNIYSDDGSRTVLVKLFESLDVKELTLDDAREFPGVANFDAIGGRLLVSSGSEPKITAYDIGEDLSWKQVGEPVSFLAYPLSDNANFFYQYLVDEHHMYMPFDVVKRIVWDPTDLKILGTKEDSILEIERGSLLLEQGGNRSGIRFQGPSLVPFFYHDEDWFDFGDESFIAVYDPRTHEESQIIAAPCAGLAIASQDEKGNTYFSTYDYGPIPPLSGLGPNPCTVRVTPGLELDEDFTTDFTEWTGGRVVANFRYVRDGWALANVFHDERSAVDFRQEEIDPVAFDEAWNEENWSVWRFDLEKGTAEPFDDVSLPSFGWTPSEIDGRSFISVPYNEGGRTKFYELDDAGTLREHLDVVGDAGWIRVK